MGLSISETINLQLCAFLTIVSGTKNVDHTPSLLEVALSHLPRYNCDNYYPVQNWAVYSAVN